MIKSKDELFKEFLENIFDNNLDQCKLILDGLLELQHTPIENKILTFLISDFQNNTISLDLIVNYFSLLILYNLSEENSTDYPLTTAYLLSKLYLMEVNKNA